MSPSNTDRIEKQIHLKAPRARVWKALTSAREFGVWFRARLSGEFVVGQTMNGNITHPGYEHLKFTVAVERMDEPVTFSFRWHPYPIDPNVDYSTEEPTLVEFHLEDHAGGTKLTVIESGFDRIPAARRDEAFRMNSNGWTAQLANIERHVDG